ncbi:aldose 1-epimerase isoform X1 [Scophthalmus maximus]|uniref:aldose 1-epimerase isoform X1 n=2 Tax=Scophthalmus maximus TaxID=52904 RepID=UPI001FA86385|nr:aldose 1-epimerase isoform X1 [Scophthalmus maximus]
MLVVQKRRQVLQFTRACQDESEECSVRQLWQSNTSGAGRKARVYSSVVSPWRCLPNRSKMTDVRHWLWGEESGLGSVDLWVLQSPSVRVEILTLGAIIRSVCSRGKDGQMGDIVLGYDDLEGYMSDKRYLGAVVGRVANRIAAGRFEVDGKEYKLDINNGPNALHGGLRGFDKAIWLATAVEGGVQLSLTSPDGDQGYPGEVQVSVTYTLKGETLTAAYQASSTKTTPINLTNHSYFNLAGQGVCGQGAADIYDHQVSISAQSYLPVDDTSIPTGEVRSVEGTPFDLREPVLIGPRLKEVPGPGFDHNFCLSSPGEPYAERHAARVCHPPTGRVLEVSTSQPGVQLYTANFLDGSMTGKGGARYGKHSSFCLETQNWPDAVNQASFPDCLLRPGEEYRHVTHFTFTIVCSDVSQRGEEKEEEKEENLKSVHSLYKTQQLFQSTFIS